MLASQPTIPLSANTLQAFAQGQQRSPFLSYPWFANLLRTVPPYAEIAEWFQHSSSGEQTWLLPLALYKHRLPFPLRIEAIANYYTPLFGFVGTEDRQSITNAAEAFAQYLQAREPTWRSVRLPCFDPTQPDLICLEQSCRAAGYWTQRFFQHKNWFLPCAHLEYRQYLAERPSALRNTLKRREKRLSREEDARIRILTSLAHVPEASNAFQRVYPRSWKRPEPYPAFIPGLILTCAEQGWLRFGIVQIDSQPIAVHFWIVANGVASIYKLAYDTTYARYSPGTILMAAMLEHVMTHDRVHTIDFLIGDDSYKRDWMTHCGERWGIMIFNPRTLAGLAAAGRHIGGHWLKQQMKQPQAPNV